MTTSALPSDTSTLDILLIEDDFVDAQIVESNLRKGGKLAFELTLAVTLAEAVEALARSPVDVVLVDLHLSDATGLDCVRRTLELSGDASVIVMTGTDEQRIATGALALGAQDYLVKGEFTAKSLQDSIAFAGERQRLRRAKEEINRRESEMKDMFLSHVSHELRTPLTAIVQFATILRDEIAGPLNDDQRRYLDIVKRNAGQLGEMVTTLMDASRAASGKLTCEPMRVPAQRLRREAIESVRLAAEAAEIRLDVDEDHGAELVLADPARILQVLQNLLGNAIKFTPAGGNIRLRTHLKEGDVQFAVEDSGCGMEPEAVERAFERLYQTGDQTGTSRNGLGLGLHICREIVKMHDGHVWAESAVGEGSTFTFSLPRWSFADELRKVAVVGGELTAGVVLVQITVRPVDARATARGVGPGVRKTAALLERSLLTSRDAVVPIAPEDLETGAVYALARTDEAGVEAIARRIEEELREDPLLGGAGYRAKVETRWFDAQPGAAGQTAAITALADRVARFIDQGA